MGGIFLGSVILLAIRRFFGTQAEDYYLQLYEDHNNYTYDEDTTRDNRAVLILQHHDQQQDLPSCFDTINKKLTRKQLTGTKEWPRWQQAEYKMLNQMKECDVLGKPIPRPKNAPP